MKLLQVVPTLGPGGAEAFAVDLAIAVREAGCSSGVHVICEIRGDRGRYLTDMLRNAGVTLSVGEQDSPKRLRSLGEVMRAVNCNDWNVVLAHLPSAEVLVCLATFLADFDGSRAVRTIHNPRRRGGLVGLLELLMSRHFNKTIACSKEVLDAIGGPSERRTFVDSGIDLRRLGPHLPTHAQWPQWPTKKLRLAMVGSSRGGLIGGQKGLDTAIEAIGRIRGSVDAELHILGCPEADQSAVRDFAKYLGTSDRIVIHGPFKSIRDELLGIAPAACLLPSRSEGLPLALLEFSCLGMPVIASDIPQVTRLSSPEMRWTIFRTGSAADLASAIQAYCKNRTAATDCSDDYAKVARSRFGFDRCRDGYLAAITSCNQ